MVFAGLSSPVQITTLPAVATVPFGQCQPLERVAANARAIVVFPLSGAPAIR